MVRGLLYTPLFLLALTTIHAQKNTVNQQFGWIRYQFVHHPNTRLVFKQELEERFHFAPFRQMQGVTRTQINRNFSKNWNGGIAFTAMHHSLPSDPNVAVTRKQIEIRPHLELTFKLGSLEKWTLEQRACVEYRSFQQMDGVFRLQNLRARYKVERKQRIGSNLTWTLFNEIMINLAPQIPMKTFDQNRIGSSLEYALGKKTGLELGYFYALQQNKAGTLFYSRHTLRFTLHHRLHKSV